MIFKYCVWSDPAKEEALIGTNGNAASAGNGSATHPVTPTGTTILREQPLNSGRKLVEGLLGCCPCAFRCRRSIGIDTPATTESPVLANGTADIPRNGDLVELRINSCDENILQDG